ncbi:MAG: ParB/RepB/Spo0J family partition protein [Anaerolineaceae bacterium]|jgi:ParB family chromosome partitioning protein
MAQKSGLGRGLESLIPGWQEEPQKPDLSRVVEIPVGNISPNPLQPRKQFDQESLNELADSIREHGVISPLVVVSTDSPTRFNLIAGERRLRAAKLAGLKTVPAVVRTASEQEQLELAIIENIQREDLNALERAQAYQNLVDSFSLTHEDIARRVGKSRAAVTNSLRLLNLPLTVQKALIEEKISEGHGRVLLSLPTDRSMEIALDTILKLSLNVRQTELLVQKMSGKKARPAAPAPRTAEMVHLENQLREFFHTKVNLQPAARGGTITIHYYSDEELNTIAERLGLNG